jgi:hypothetical protein
VSYNYRGVKIRSKRIKTVLIIGIIFLFIVSSVTPMVIGYNFNPEDEELCKYIDHVYACNYFDELWIQLGLCSVMMSGIQAAVHMHQVVILQWLNGSSS